MPLQTPLEDYSSLDIKKRFFYLLNENINRMLFKLYHFYLNMCQRSEQTTNGVEYSVSSSIIISVGNEAHHQNTVKDSEVVASESFYHAWQALAEEGTAP